MPLPDEYGVSVFGDRSRADFLRTERRSSRVGLGACRRKGLGMGLYGSSGATTDQELQSALEARELAISKDTEPQADAEALAALGHVGAVLGLQGKKADRDVEFEERLNRTIPEDAEATHVFARLRSVMRRITMATPSWPSNARGRPAPWILAMRTPPRRLVAAYVAVGNKLANEAETQTKEVLSFTQMRNLEPHMRAMLEEGTSRVARRTRGTWRRWRSRVPRGAGGGMKSFWFVVVPVVCVPRAASVAFINQAQASYVAGSPITGERSPGPSSEEQPAEVPAAGSRRR